MADVRALQQALEAYKRDHHTYHVEGAGMGGMGWVGYTVDGGPTLVKVLHDGGYLPSSDVNDTSRWGQNYMIYLRGDEHYSISATLDQPSAADVIHAQTTCNATGSERNVHGL
jgi:hypothetical protein